MKFSKPLTVIATVIPLVLTGCVTDPITGQQSASRTTIYGLGGAAVCGIVGALIHGDKGTRNSALVCGAVDAGIGGYTGYQEKKLRQGLANASIEVERQNNQIELVMPENTTFATGSTALSGRAQGALSATTQTLVRYPDMTLIINDHTDNTGNDAINKLLSHNRAEFVAALLQPRDVSSTRLSTFGYGSRQPIASNATVEGRAQNRRIEILINPDQRAIDTTKKQI